MKQEGKVESVLFVAIGHSEISAPRSSASSSPIKQQVSQKLFPSLWNTILQKYMLRSPLMRDKYSLPLGISTSVVCGIQSSKIFTDLLVQHLCHGHAN